MFTKAPLLANPFTGVVLSKTFRAERYKENTINLEKQLKYS